MTCPDGEKPLWALFIIVIPWLGALVYLVARGRSMNERTRAQAQRQDYASDSTCGRWREFP